MTEIAQGPEAIPPLVPARILNEHTYCPRLAWLEWSERLFTDNADTAEGTYVHRRVDRPRGRAPAPAPALEGEALPETTSLVLDAPRLGVSAKLDVVRLAGGTAIPVEYKRGRPDSDGEVRAPERVQLAAYAEVLRENGYTVDRAEVWFNETRTRVRVELGPDDTAAVSSAVAEVRANAIREVAPPPLIDSPKCPRCSLVGLCLPDETNRLRGVGTAPPRRLIAAAPTSAPLYATTPGARLTKRGGQVILKERGEETGSRRLLDVSHIAVFGNVDVSSGLLHECFARGIPVLWLSMAGWFHGAAFGTAQGGVELRIRQHRAAAIGRPDIAGAMIAGKIRNQRTLLRRHCDTLEGDALGQLAALAEKAEACWDVPSLLGLEGAAARIYFGRFGDVLHGGQPFDFTARTRRPARDRVNAVLSFTYSLLLRDVIVATHAAGLDPYVGLLHRPRFGRPSLALDLMEEFRPLVGDSTTMLVINNGELRPSDTVERGGAVALTAPGRRRVIDAYERRMRTQLTHPLFGYKAEYRRVLEIQARLLASAIAGETDAYRPLTTR